MNNIFKTNRIKYKQLYNDTQEYLVNKYNQSRNIFTIASPFGQILEVLHSYSQLFFLYLEDVLVELNIFTANKEKSVFGWARLAGHNPTRAISAHGTLKIKVNQSALPDINASYILLLNETKLKNLKTGLLYFIKLNSLTGSIKIDLTSSEYIPIKIIQGEIETQNQVSNGQSLQSYNFQAKRPIDNDNIEVYVNGENYEILDSFIDMKKGSKQCIIKTGISGGIDLYFGNEDYGYIPETGSNIEIKYIKSDGFTGNIFGKSNTVQFKWEDVGFTNIGDEVDLNEFLITEVDKSIVLGSDAENFNLTKLIAPKTSRSMVLAHPDNYVSLLSRFNYSYVDAYTTYDDDYLDDDNIIYLFLLPDIKRRLDTNTDYFTTNLENFILDEDEKEALSTYINKTGSQIVTTELSFVDPIIKLYVLNIFLRIFDTADQNTIKSEILSKVSDYFLTVNRRDKIPKSDLIAIIENIEGIDSVSISFISKENEEAIQNGYYFKNIIEIDKIRGIKTVVQQKISIDIDTNSSLGLDEFGDIKIGLNELPLIRGGWIDRFNNEYLEGIDYTQYSSVNIIVKDVIKESLSVKMMNKNKQILK